MADNRRMVSLARINCCRAPYLVALCGVVLMSYAATAAKAYALDPKPAQVNDVASCIVRVASARDGAYAFSPIVAWRVLTVALLKSQRVNPTDTGAKDRVEFLSKCLGSAGVPSEREISTAWTAISQQFTADGGSFSEANVPNVAGVPLGATVGLALSQDPLAALFEGEGSGTIGETSQGVVDLYAAGASLEVHSPILSQALVWVLPRYRRSEPSHVRKRKENTVITRRSPRAAQESA